MPRIGKTSVNDPIRAQLEFRLKFHPLRIFTYLVLVGISSAFLFLSVSYFATTIGTDFNKFHLPLLFHANTIIILVSSYTISQTRKALMNDDENGYMKGLLVTAGLGVAFTIFQVMGWMELMRSGIKLTNSVAGAYLYVISGLHLVHLLVGVAILLWFTANALNKQNDPVKLLLFESNPFSKMKVELLCTYWHFVDGIWIYFYLFFLLNIYVFTKW
ncbi:MAG: cytochrome c oxidase subunit [Bacteroidota bacterium]|nr:cytochrome c oxidase subunit [Bacteroidota bacterium]